MLKEPLVEHYFEANTVLDRGFYEELDDLRRVSLDQPCEDEDE